MTLDDATLDLYARMAARQLIQNYMPQAYNFNLSKEDLKKLIKKTADYAVKIIDGSPS